MRKKLLSVVMAATLALGLLTGCSKETNNETTTQQSSQTETTTTTEAETTTTAPAETTTTETTTAAPIETTTAEPETTTTSPSADSGDDGLTAIELTHLMGNGINLGNTMEAYGHTSIGVGADTSAYETLWGQPITTAEMIAGMKAAGFDTLRIPVAWTNAMKYESGDYTIGEDYLNRVEEIINYALDADMYVIVNDHWDGSWWGMFGSASQETRDAAMDLYVSMWTQIATRYEQYDEHLIFESANEELGDRLNDKDVAKDSGTLSKAECYEMANLINQTFVDTIRSTGGNNADRFLLIAGYNTDIANTCDDAYKMPTDTAKDKLIISVHYYTPSGYCIDASISSWGDKKDFNDQAELLAMMEKYTSQGYGVVIGEWGVLKQSSGLREGTLEFNEFFLDACDYYGYCPVLWDTNDMFNRNTCKIAHDEVAQIYLDHSFASQSSMTIDELKAKAKADMDAAIEAAPEAAGVDDRTALAWIMYSSSDWAISYSVGDVYDPDAGTAGVVATTAEITGEGTYTVALDFTGTAAGYANSVAFSAIGLANGEVLYPGYCIEIKEILINGEKYFLTGRPYTTSDDAICTRVNLFNAWVSSIPDSARTAAGNVMYVSPCVLDADTLGNVKTIEVTFDYVPGK